VTSPFTAVTTPKSTPTGSAARAAQVGQSTTLHNACWGCRFEAVRKSLETIIQYSQCQGLIPRRFSVDELFNDVTRSLD